MSLNSLFFVTFCKTTRGTRPCPSHASASPRPLFLIPRLWGCSLGVIRKVLRKTARGYLSWNRSLSLDPWLRYSPVRSILRRSTDLTVGRVLDVGSGTAGLASSLAVPTVALDVAFPGTGPASRKSLTERVKASATHLPFRNSSFGAVVSIDMIEHLALDDLTARLWRSSIREGLAQDGAKNMRRMESLGTQSTQRFSQLRLRFIRRLVSCGTGMKEFGVCECGGNFNSSYRRVHRYTVSPSIPFTGSIDWGGGGTPIAESMWLVCRLSLRGFSLEHPVAF